MLLIVLINISELVNLNRGLLIPVLHYFQLGGVFSQPFLYILLLFSQVHYLSVILPFDLRNLLLNRLSLLNLMLLLRDFGLLFNIDLCFFSIGRESTCFPKANLSIKHFFS